jgi:hypothetical protein
VSDDDQSRYNRPLTREELDELAGEPLPERAAMSLIRAQLFVPPPIDVPPDPWSGGEATAAPDEQA